MIRGVAWIIIFFMTEEGFMAPLATPLPVTPRQAIAYVRVSPEDQAISVEAQRTLIMHWCKTHDVGLNGNTPIERRPGLFKVLSALQRGMALVVARRDRLARAEDIEKGRRYDARSAAINFWSHHWQHPAAHHDSEILGTFYFA
jgi:hypothetical protein